MSDWTHWDDDEYRELLDSPASAGAEAEYWRGESERWRRRHDSVSKALLALGGVFLLGVAAAVWMVKL